MEYKLPKKRGEKKNNLKSDHRGAHPGAPPFEYNRITDNIFIGTNMCCQSHFDQRLLDKGIKVDISLEGEKIDHPYGVDSYTWIPIKNHRVPTAKQADLFVNILDKLMSDKQKVYIHCKNGHGRAPMMVAAYFISKGIGVKEALTKIKEKRPSIHLDTEQLDFLKKFAEKNIINKMFK